MKPVSRVEVSHGVFCNCIAHALTTEKEEIMGLLLGDTVAEESGELVTHIWKVVPQIRKDRRKDRVECSSTQMAEVAQLAEQETRNSNRTTRVVGWYHSHPHITALPSHVDVQTQASYQALDEGFVGIIVSCFNSLQVSEQGDRIQVIAFQSMQRAGPDIGGSDDDVEEDALMRAALRESREEAARQEGPMWDYTLLPVSLVADGTAARDAALHDVVARINSLKLEEWTPYAEEMARLDAAPPPPAELFARTVYCTGVLQHGMADLLQGSILPTLTALHAQAFTLAQRRRAALDKLIMYQEAVSDKLVEPNPKLDEVVNQHIKHHLQLNDAALAQEHSVHSATAGHVQHPHRAQQQPQQPQQPALSQAAQQQPPQHAQQRQVPQQQSLPQPQGPALRQPQHQQQAHQQPGSQQQRVARSHAAKDPSLNRQPSNSEMRSGEAERSGSGVLRGHAGGPMQPGHAIHEPSAVVYPPQPQHAAGPRHSVDAGRGPGVAGMHAAYQQPQGQHQLQYHQQQHAAQQHVLQQQAQHAQQAQLAQTTQQAQHAPHIQMQQLQIQAARAQAQQMAQSQPWQELDGAQRAQHGVRQAAHSQGQAIRQMYQASGMPAAGQQMHHPAAVHAHNAVPHTARPMNAQAPPGHRPAAGYTAGLSVAHLLPGQGEGHQERVPVASAAEGPPGSGRHKWQVSDPAVCNDFLTRTGTSPTPPAGATASGAQPGGAGADPGTAATSRRSNDARPSRTEATGAAPHPPAAPAHAPRIAAQPQRPVGGVSGSSRPTENGRGAPQAARGARDEAPPQNGVHEGASAELPAAPAAPAQQPAGRAPAWGRQAPLATQGAVSAGRGAVQQPPPPAPKAAPPPQPPQKESSAADVQVVDTSQEPSSNTTAPPAAPKVAGAWGSGGTTFASMLKSGGGAAGAASAPLRAAPAAAAVAAGAGQSGGLTSNRGEAPARQGRRDADPKGGTAGPKGVQGDTRQLQRNSRGGKGSRSGRSGNLGDAGQVTAGGRKSSGNSSRLSGRAGGGGTGAGGGGGGEAGERSARKG